MTDHQALLRECAADDAMFHGPHTGNGGHQADTGDALPIVMRDDSFFDAVDSLIVAVRWPLLCFAVVAMLLFIVAMISHLSWAK